MHQGAAGALRPGRAALRKGEPLAGWGDFAVAQVGASAALAGLVFVASTVIVPGHSLGLLGAKLAAIGLVDWLVVVGLQYAARRIELAARPRAFALRVVLGQLATLPFIVAGIALASRGESGLYWFALAAFGSYAVAFVDAWVLLVEINR